VTVVDAMLGNAAVAAVLALGALAVGCVCRSPAVRHIAWLLVLLKLVTPPLVTVPLPVLPASASTFAIPSFEFTQWALVVWALGMIGWFVWQGRRVIRFRRKIARAEDAHADVIEATRRLAAALGIVRPPTVKIATGIGSPMLWGWGRGTVVLFPRELLARLSAEARDTLLAHELAHFRRRDHWVRVLEYLVTGLFWWHPVVWLARREIEAAEEECCDAWVVGGLAASPRRYAEALLATVDYVAELQRPCLPPGACAANRSSRLLHRRLVGIINAKRPSQLRGMVVLRGLAVVALLIQPVLRAAPPEVSPPLDPVAAYNPVPGSPPCPRVPKPVEPRAWATAAAPSGVLTVIARDHEVLLRRPDGTATTLGPGRPLALAFAPTGKQLATVGPGTQVRTWDDRGSLITEAHVLAAARSAVYTPDGTRLLVLDNTGGITVLDPHTLALVTRWTVEGPANSLSCSPDGQTVAVACGSWLADTGWVECWSITERRKVAHYSAPGPVGATRFTPDGRVLIVGGWNGFVSWRALPNGELIAARQLAKDAVATAAFSPDAGTLPLEPPPELAPPPSLVLPPELIQEISLFPKN